MISRVISKGLAEAPLRLAIEITIKDIKDSEALIAEANMTYT